MVSVANFNDFDDVREWIADHSLGAVEAGVRDRVFAGKTLAVAQAYLDHIEAHGYDAVEQDDDEDDDPKWEWRPWRIVVVALFLIGPALLIWAINHWR